MAVTLREARPVDRDAIVDVTLAAYQEYATQVPFWTAYRENILATITNPHPATQLVADLDGTIVGTVLLYPAAAAGAVSAPGQGRWPEVRLLAVAPSARGKGIALALMQECVRLARAARSDALTLHTMASMQAALRLYTRMGFQPAPELNFQPVPGFTVSGYRLTLGPPIE
jgi:ribosomal protein S18 acetylase RimI-like enzyme